MRQLDFSFLDFQRNKIKHCVVFFFLILNFLRLISIVTWIDTIHSLPCWVLFYKVGTACFLYPVPHCSCFISVTVIKCPEENNLGTREGLLLDHWFSSRLQFVTVGKPRWQPLEQLVTSTHKSNVFVNLLLLWKDSMTKATYRWVFLGGLTVSGGESMNLK